MNTNDLISALAADVRTKGWPIERALALSLLMGGAVTLLLFWAFLGPRPDVVSAITTWRFDLKVALMALAFLVAMVDAVRLTRPEPMGPLHWTSVAVVLVVASGVTAELASIPTDEWLQRALGHNSLLCVTAIPALAVAPLIVALWFMRAGAPARPAWAGAAIGCMAGSFGAMVYAIHCWDDSPLFVAVWYSIAILLVSVVGAVAGRTFLRW